MMTLTAAYLRGLFPTRCLFTLLMTCAAGLASATCEKTLRWDDDPPYSLQRPDGSITGIYVDTNLAALERLGCVVTLRKLPWARALKELEQGRLDILPGAFRLAEREEYAYFSGAVLPSSRNILFIRKDVFERWPITKLLELRQVPFRLGAQINVHYGPDYETLMSNPDFARTVAMVANRSNLWSMIAKGRIDGAIADEYTGAYEIRELDLSDRITASNVVVSNAAAEVAFSKRSNDLEFVQAYAEALKELGADGSYQSIVQRHVLPR